MSVRENRQLCVYFASKRLSGKGEIHFEQRKRQQSDREQQEEIKERRSGRRINKSIGKIL